MTASETTAGPLKAIVVYETPADPHTLAEVLTDVTHLSPTDALIHARSAPGVLPDRLSLSQAELLVQRLSAVGLSTEAIDPAELIDFHAPDVAHQIRLQEQGVTFATDHGGGFLPWDKIHVISAGQIPLESTRRLNSNDEQMFVAARRSHHEARRAALPPTMELWLVTNQKPIQIDQTRMNYETLGDAKTGSSTENFRELLKRLTEMATGANVTPATQAFLAHGSALKYIFNSTDELQRVTQLQSLLARRK